MDEKVRRDTLGKKEKSLYGRGKLLEVANFTGRGNRKKKYLEEEVDVQTPY